MSNEKTIFGIEAAIRIFKDKIIFCEKQYKINEREQAYRHSINGQIYAYKETVRSLEVLLEMAKED